MNKLFTKMLLLLPLLLSVTAVLAQSEEAAGPSTFAGRPTLWLAIIIGFIASFLTLFYAYRLRGGVVGTALTLFGVGMLLVVAGFLAVAIAWTDEATQATVHDVAFIIGYALMVGGGLRLRQIA